MDVVQKLFPNGGWDVHYHIFEPDRFPYSSNRHLTPPPATIDQFLEHIRKLGITNSVLTHGLSYGSDCSSLRTFVAELGPSKTKAIGVIDPQTVTAEELASMHHDGIRGIRVNVYQYQAMHDVKRQMSALRDHSRVLHEHCPGWSMAFTHTHPEFWVQLKPFMEQEIIPTGIKVVTDHFALLKGASMLQAEKGVSDATQQSGFKEIIELVRNGHIFVKISAPYRVSNQAPNYEDLKPLVRALLDANPRQILWGSDWPHGPPMTVRSREEAMTEIPFLEIDDLAWLKSLRSWLSAEEWNAVMVTNPRALYDW
ncbi:hypothetical protein BGW36DRAFT_353297 [Talaromyces proteolyticus]|uniref:Amidohydrolase-related domain-containing protein n=1 Tax=Talaromyces proteolyticus TaxID=1131652 RepID=A0AAD4L1F8_9EURO|nr:uncharacterized protein BGW36DRAFT_353297 [Talaromyces proteolyticus]KAH8704856.1 hypothetical protein BGW36DRAFT_353297 [Talaromyces proteolyticus]